MTLSGYHRARTDSPCPESGAGAVVRSGEALMRLHWTYAHEQAAWFLVACALIGSGLGILHRLSRG